MNDSNLNDLDRVQCVVTGQWSEGAAGYDTHPTSVLHVGEAAGVWRGIWAAGLPDPPVEVLDVGTGTGQVAMELWRLGHRVTGVDLAGGMLDLARDKACRVQDPPVFVIGDAVAPPFPEGSFDAATARYLLWTLREPVRALSNWRELLRPGGRLAIVDGVWGDAYADAYDSATMAALPLATATSVEAYTAVVEAAGFGEIAVEELTELYDIEHRHSLATDGVDPAKVRLQYLITARRP